MYKTLKTPNMCMKLVEIQILPFGYKGKNYSCHSFQGSLLGIVHKISEGNEGHTTTATDGTHTLASSPGGHNN